ncbi:MAG: cell division protein FtsZ [Bacteroidales bacterium]|nr:cell division protein FtsZ [Bacteroidales bacterium]
MTGMTMEFEPLRQQPAKIKVIGVGGGGGNAVNHMFRQGIRGVDFIVCNTDAKALAASPVPNKIELGKLGAGNIPEHARKAAIEHKDEIRAAISDDTQMLFITAGMGGGTGTGAAPVIAEIAKSIEIDDDMVPRILVVAIVTMPFSFEGKRRKEQAAAGIEELKKHVDAILVINNDKLRLVGGNLPLNQAFSQADDVLLTAAKGIAEIITVSAYVNIDFRDVNTVMEKSGTALMGAGEGRGENRASIAIKEATTSVLLDDNDIRGAKNILLYFSYSPSHQITMDELGEVTDYLTELTGDKDTNVIWGAGDDDSLNDELRITLIATGFEQRPGPTVHTLELKESDLPSDKPAIVIKPTDNTEETTEETAKATTEEQQPTDAIDNSLPKPTAEMNGRRIFVLDTPVAETEEKEEEKEPVAETVAPVIATTGSLLDEIRVISRPTPQPKTESVAPAEPVFHIEPTVALAEEPEPEPAHVDAVTTDSETTFQPETIVERQVEQAFQPSEDLNDAKLRQRAERIRRMNDLLHNDPNGPKQIEDMTTSELTSEPIYQTPHSAESDAARKRINLDGSISTGISFLTDLPD